MNVRQIAALCSAVAPFAVYAGWLAGWALDGGQEPYVPVPVVAAVAPTTAAPVLLIETPAPAPETTAARVAVRAVPAVPTTSAPTTTSAAPTTSTAPTSSVPPSPSSTPEPPPSSPSSSPVSTPPETPDSLTH